MLEITVRKIASAPLLFAHKVSHLLSQRKAGEELLCVSSSFCEWESVDLAQKKSPDIFSTSTNSICHL